MFDHEHWMDLALAQATAAENLGEVPVGAVLVRDNQLIAQGCNQPISTNDPTGHAEVVVLRKAAALVENYRLPDSTLYVTIEPCTMCVGAMLHARIKTLVFGAREPRAGAVCSHLQLLNQSGYNHAIEFVEGIKADECSAVLKNFFRVRRQ